MRIGNAHRWILTAALLLGGQSLYGQYSGPSVLSRAGSPTGMRNAPLAFRPYISVTGIYETGLTPFASDEFGEVPSDSSAGVEASAGAYLYHNWRRTTAGFDYRGAYRHYTRQQFYDGIDQFMGLAVSHQINAKTAVRARQTLGLFSRGFGVFPGQISTFGAPSLVQTPAISPNAELFDNRTTHLSSTAELVRQLTPRASVGVGGSAFFVRRRSDALVGVNGYTAQSDFAYRVSRRSTVGVNYSFIRFDFARAFGGANVHGVGVNYAWSVSRRWELGFMAAGYRVETTSVRPVQLDPLVALITGQTTGIEAFNARNYINGYGARVSRSFRQSGLTMSYMRGISPGNGLMTTSQAESVDANYSYSGIRRWNLAAMASYQRFRSLAQISGTYESYIAGGGFSRAIGRTGLHTIGRVDFRRYETSFAAISQRSQIRVSLGVSYSPGDIPLSLW
jgi:hypothetical protein